MSVVITGASQGIGRALAFEFARHGHPVVLNARTETHLQKVANEIRSRYPEHRGVLVVPGDVRSPDVAHRIIASAVERFGNLRVLINNAGVGIYDRLWNLNPEEFRETWEVNVLGTLLATQAALPFLRKSRGTVIAISSVAGLIPVPGMGGYCATKFAQDALMSSLRIELRGTGVRVLVVYPGPIATGFTRHAKGSERPMPALQTDRLVRPWQSPERLARAIYTAYRRKRRTLIFPWWYHIPVWLYRYMPRLYDFLAGRVVASEPKDEGRPSS